MGTGFLFVVLYPYRMFILHLLIALLILMLAVVWLIVVVKVRRRMRARRQQVLLLYPSPRPLCMRMLPVNIRFAGAMPVLRSRRFLTLRVLTIPIFCTTTTIDEPASGPLSD